MGCVGHPNAVVARRELERQDLRHAYGGAKPFAKAIRGAFDSGFFRAGFCPTPDSRTHKFGVKAWLPPGFCSKGLPSNLGF
mmetsp:Transcript_96502/g.223757  ORF Transcript_96502/g.223757 Transcript_96502/m.223757 type:complete len:81 (-) Transcript_96502:502-744(-)